MAPRKKFAYALGGFAAVITMRGMGTNVTVWDVAVTGVVFYWIGLGLALLYRQIRRAWGRGGEPPRKPASAGDVLPAASATSAVTPIPMADRLEQLERASQLFRDGSITAAQLAQLRDEILASAAGRAVFEGSQTGDAAGATIVPTPDPRSSPLWHYPPPRKPLGRKRRPVWTKDPTGKYDIRYFDGLK